MPKHDLWRVRIGSSVVEMDLDELVAAFQNGQIEANTLVIAPGDLRWSTLSAVADLGDDDNDRDASPPSVAPMAYDTAEVDIRFGEGDDDGLAPKKKRRIGRISGIVLAYAVLIAVGAGAGAYRAAPGEVRAKVSAVQAKLTKKSSTTPAAAVAAAPPPVAAPLPPPAAAPAPPPPVVVAAPKATPPAPSQVGTSIDSLPTAKPAVSTKPAPPRRRTR